MSSATSPEVRLSRSGNSYDFVRFVAASMVLYSHHFAISQCASSRAPLNSCPEPIVPFFGEKFGALAVYIFFSLSGFLIFRSLQKNASVWRFAAARFLRVMPNLAVALTLSSLVTLLYFGNFAHLKEHVLYVVRGLLLIVLGPAYEIPGVFDGTPYPALNGPLWSLRYELHMYLVLFAVVTFAGRYRGLVLAGMLPLLVYHWAFNKQYTYIIWGADLFEYSRLGQTFLSGALLAYLWPRWGRHALAAGLAGVALCAILEAVIPFSSFLNSLALGLAVIGLGSSRAMAWFGKGGDGSYGMYIYAWPIQKFCVMFIASFWGSMAVAFVLTVAAGYTTWHLFEKRCMAQVDRVASWLRMVFMRLAGRTVAVGE